MAREKASAKKTAKSAAAKPVAKATAKKAVRKTAKKAPSETATAKGKVATEGAPTPRKVEKKPPRPTAEKKTREAKAATAKKPVEKKPAEGKKSPVRKPAAKRTPAAKVAPKPVPHAERGEESPVTATETPSPRASASSEPQAHPDANLTKAQVRKLKDLLLKERDAVIRDLRRYVSEATADSSPLVEEADLAQRATEQDYQLRLADKQRKLLDQIQVALRKMETGEYGICEGTEEPIGYPRLEIRPWARYSVEYKAMLDRRNR